MAQPAHTSLAMSETAASQATSDRAGIDAALEALVARKAEWAGLAIRERITLLEAILPRFLEFSPEWVRVACGFKGLAVGTPEEGEEWLGGPVVTARNVRLLIQTLKQIERAGTPELGAKVFTRPDGRVVVRAMPTDLLDSLVFQGFTGDIWMEPGLTEGAVRERQASFYKKPNPTGGLCCILGAGNQSSIPPMDALAKLFAEGMVCLIKMNPVNEAVGPVLEKVFKPLIERNFLRIVYGGGDVGAYLTQHPAVDDIHITGSDRTHDLIVWGPPGPDRDRRRAAKDPVLKKTISSELGNVSPVIVAPAKFSDAQLKFVARNVASQMTNNASFNCNAAKMLVTAKGWPQKDAFLALVKGVLAKVTTRKAYYPGAEQRFEALTAGKDAERIGDAPAGKLPWTLVTGLDPAKDEPQFTTEPFCSLISHVELPELEPAKFLAAATTFANDRLWGTLNACLIIHPSLEKDDTVAAALDKAVVDLRYGTVSINHWPALGYGFASTPWGGHPSATLENIQSGLGWVHNTYLLEGIEKAVIRGPLIVKPNPAWFVDNRMTHEIGPPLLAMQVGPSLLKLPALLSKALRG